MCSALCNMYALHSATYLLCTLQHVCSALCNMSALHYATCLLWNLQHVCSALCNMSALHFATCLLCTLQHVYSALCNMSALHFAACLLCPTYSTATFSSPKLCCCLTQSLPLCLIASSIEIQGPDSRVMLHSLDTGGSRARECLDN